MSSDATIPNWSSWGRSCFHRSTSLDFWPTKVGHHACSNVDIKYNNGYSVFYNPPFSLYGLFKLTDYKIRSTRYLYLRHTFEQALIIVQLAHSETMSGDVRQRPTTEVWILTKSVATLEHFEVHNPWVRQKRSIHIKTIYCIQSKWHFDDVKVVARKRHNWVAWHGTQNAAALNPQLRQYHLQECIKYY